MTTPLPRIPYTLPPKRAAAQDAGLPYAVPNSLVEWVPHDAAIPVGYWRSVGMSFNTSARSRRSASTPARGRSPFTA